MMIDRSVTRRPVHPVLWAMAGLMIGLEVLFAAVEAGLARLVGNDPEGLTRELREAHAGSAWADAVKATSNPFG